MASAIKSKLTQMATGAPADAPDKDEINKYKLKVTAGTSYQDSTRHSVTVNGKDCILGDNCRVAVRIHEYQGVPGQSVAQSPYFKDAAHSKDTYSIAFSWAPKEDVSAEDLVWGLELVNPIGDRIPKRFITTAFDVVKRFVDPSLICDPYADQPWLNGAILCGSAMTFRIGGKQKRVAPTKDVLVEGADGDGESIRRDHGIPDDEGKRRKFFGNEENRKGFTFEKGRCYQFDFHNGYIDWKDYSLKLPGFSINVLNWVNDRTHTVRFAMKNRKTGQQYLIVTFRLLFGAELDQALKAGKRPQNKQNQKKGDSNVSEDDVGLTDTDHEAEKDDPKRSSIEDSSPPERHSPPQHQSSPEHQLPPQQQSPPEHQSPHSLPKHVSEKTDQDRQDLQAEIHEKAQTKPLEGEPGPKPDHQTQAQVSLDEDQQWHPTQTQETSNDNNDNDESEDIRHASNQTDAQLASSTNEQCYLSTEHYKVNSIQDDTTAGPEQSEHVAPTGNGYRSSIEESLCQTLSVDGRNKLSNVLE